MNDKVKIPYISDTVVINGIYYPDTRMNTKDRRKINKKVLYERRMRPDRRNPEGSSVDIFV